MHIFIGVVYVVLGHIQLLPLVLNHHCKLLLDGQHILHLVLDFKQLLGLGFDQLSLQQHILVHFHHFDAIGLLVIR